MKRYIKFTILVPNAQNISGGFKQLFKDKVKIKENKGDGSIELNDCTFDTETWNGKKFISADGEPIALTVWVENPTAQLFKFKDEFEWIDGIVRLWASEILVTKNNYMDIDYKDMSDIQPVIEEII